MSASNSAGNARPFHVIRFDDPRLHGANRTASSDPRPVQLDSQQQRRIRKYSKKFGPIIEQDQYRRKLESRFIDWNNQCSARTTKAIVRIITDRAWPDDLPLRGANLLDLYAGFRIFECDLASLENSSGFQQALEHLVYHQDLSRFSNNEDSAIGIVQGGRKYIWMRFKTEFDFRVYELEQSSPYWADRLIGEMKQNGIYDDLTRYHEKRPSTSNLAPKELNRIFQLIDSLLAPPQTPIRAEVSTPMGSRGSRALAGVVFNVLDRFHTRPPTADAASETSEVLESTEHLESFQLELDDILKQVVDAGSKKVQNQLSTVFAFGDRRDSAGESNGIVHRFAGVSAAFAGSARHFAGESSR